MHPPRCSSLKSRRNLLRHILLLLRQQKTKDNQEKVSTPGKARIPLLHLGLQHLPPLARLKKRPSQRGICKVD